MPTGTVSGSATTGAERAAKQRRQKLEQVREQLGNGSRTDRQMTSEERARWARLGSSAASALSPWRPGTRLWPSCGRRLSTLPCAWRPTAAGRTWGSGIRSAALLGASRIVADAG
jgi:hypothetical protein